MAKKNLLPPFPEERTNPSLRSALFAPLQPTDEHLGNMVEQKRGK